MEENVIKRVMPHSAEAESSVIGSMLIDQEAIAAAMELVSGEDFYLKQYALVFNAMTALYNEGKPVDLITLQNKLKETGAPDEVTSLSYVSDLVAATPNSANVRQYARIVADKALLRRMISVNEAVASSCYAQQESAEEIMGKAEKDLFRVLQQRGSSDFTPIREIVIDALKRIENAGKTKGTVTGLATGFTDLDYNTSGFQPSDLILIAARPSMGKTAFVLNIAEYMALRKNKCVALFSLEMSREQLVNRLFAMESSVDSQLLRTGNLSDGDWDVLLEGANVIGSSRLIIDDTPGISVPELTRKCRKYKLEQGIDIVIIDYLQLMAGSRRAESRQNEVAEISRSLKGLARELNVPVVALSQLSRAVEQRPDHRPMLSDLRESGSIEQDADVVMFLYREDYYNKDTERKDIAEVIIAKQRNGPIGTVELVWLPKYTKFANMEKGRGNYQRES